MKKKEKRKNDSRVKTRKGGLEQKQENFQRLMGRATEKWKNNDQTAFEASMRSSTLFKTEKLNLPFQNAFPRIPESITMGLDACQIAMFRD